MNKFYTVLFVIGTIAYTVLHFVSSTQSLGMSGEHTQEIFATLQRYVILLYASLIYEKVRTQ